MDTETSINLPDAPLELRTTHAPPKIKPSMPIFVDWLCKAGHITNERVEGGHINLVRCRTCLGTKGQPIVSGQIHTDSDAEAFVAFTPGQAGEVRGSLLWEMFCELLDHYRGQNGVGTKSDRWCVTCQDENHMHQGQCRCPCHKAHEYRQAVENPSLADA